MLTRDEMAPAIGGCRISGNFIGKGWCSCTSTYFDRLAILFSNGLSYYMIFGFSKDPTRLLGKSGKVSWSKALLGLSISNYVGSWEANSLKIALFLKLYSGLIRFCGFKMVDSGMLGDCGWMILLPCGLKFWLRWILSSVVKPMISPLLRVFRLINSSMAGWFGLWLYLRRFSIISLRDTPLTPLFSVSWAIGLVAPVC